jgi:hypothetical protein
MGTLGRAIYSVGFWIRETGQAIDRLGSRLQGDYYFQEQRQSLFLFLDPFSLSVITLPLCLRSILYSISSNVA